LILETLAFQPGRVAQVVRIISCPAAAAADVSRIRCELSDLFHIEGIRGLCHPAHLMVWNIFAARARTATTITSHRNRYESDKIREKKPG